MSHALVTLRNVSVTLGGKSVLRELNADILQESVTALIGLNGSGKTTLLRAVLREVPYRGEIAFHCGHDHRRPAPEHVGYVPQKLRIEANLPLTVRDLLGLALQRRPLFLGIGRRTARKLIELLDLVGARHDLLDSPVDKISGGELQRILLGLALEPHPELLLLDEPAAGIDFQDQEKFYDLIARINRERKTTILLVSHEITMVSRRAGHVLCLKDGQVHCQGPPSQILTEEMLAQIFGIDRAVYAHRHAD
jgi:zinc transport system ATP-binding protein